MINVLVIPSDNFGVGKFRSIDPHVYLQKEFKEEFYVQIEHEPDYEDVEFFKNFDLVHIHKVPSNQYTNGLEIIKRLQSWGCFIVVDNDDYWDLGAEHPANLLYKKQKYEKHIKDCIKQADAITTTTPLFAEEISKLNENVFIIPNAIDPNKKQYQPNPEPNPNEYVRLGWLGGSSHNHDLATVTNVYPNEVRDKIQFVLCGFDLRGHKTVRRGQELVREQLKPEETVWYEYEKRLTNNYRMVSDKYRNVLEKYNEQIDYDDTLEPYRRVWTKPVNKYAFNYNKFDVSLAPLKPTMFNKMKSQLKVIESGFHKKALIATDFGPYQIDLVDALNSDGTLNDVGNAILINPRKAHKEWKKKIKIVAENPEMINILGERLYDTVKNKYSMKTVTNYRAELYKQLLKK